MPLDYTPTEQDKLDVAAGKLNLGTMGGDTIEIEEVQMLMWVDGEVRYLLFSRGGAVFGDELVAMAKQIIDQA